ncbi:MAG: MMPL family transporter [Planctomycetes bacterium]|nr:MMPL family transporter [Planctomycetota bacterium]
MGDPLPTEAEADGHAPRAALAAAAAMILVAGLGIGLSWLTIDVSNQAMFIEGDPAIVSYDKFRDDFGSDEAVFVLVEVPDAFADPWYQRLIDLGEALDALPWVDSVRSPLRSPLAYSEGDQIVSKSVTEVGPQTPEERAFWRAKATEFRPFKGLLISEDARYVGFLARLAHTPGEHLTPQDRRQIVEEFTSVLDSERFRDLPHSALGSPVMPFYFSQILKRELTFATILGLLATAGCLFLLFRSVRAVFAPLLVAVCSLLGAIGLMGWLGMPVTVLTPILLSLMICVGVADAMHLLAAYQRLVVEGAEPNPAMREAIREVWRPCLYTSVTTAVGFAALVTSEIVPVAQLGITAALGSLLAYVLTLTISPFLALGWRPRPTPTASALTQLLERLLWIANRGRYYVVGGALVCVVASMAGGFPVVDNDFLRTLSKGEPLRDWIEFTHERMGGVVSAELVLEPVHPGNTEELALILREASEFGAWLQGANPLVSRVSGVYDAVEEMHVLYDGPREVSLDDAVNEQLLLMVQSSDPEFYEQNITIDGSAVRLTLRMDMAASSRYGVLKKQIEDELEHRFRGADGEPLVKIYLTGAAMLMNRANEYLIATQIRSFAISLICVSLLVFLGVCEPRPGPVGLIARIVVGLAILGTGLSWWVRLDTTSHLLPAGVGLVALIAGFRNLKLGLLSLVPNLLPVAVVVGGLAWLDVRVNMTTALVGAIVLGIIVDDTIHVVVSLRRGLTAGHSLEDALRATLLSSGRAVIFTSLTLSLCFAIYLFSALANVRAFGLLTAVTFLLALVADLLVLPALLFVFSSDDPPPPASAPQAGADA